ncbi:MAG TPA: tetratricopeptide repeat protein [Verrucomicrobiae bacterium]|nr:tetratricopeptide repeat protein [Verrucomicrobiae bacterium]
MDLRQWSRAAGALALLFASFPLVGRLVLGRWEFAGAGELACLLLLAGAYLHFRSRRYATRADPATLLARARDFAAGGRTDRALSLLTRTIRQNPRLWQAYQYRGELRLRLGAFELAAQDFAEAIRLAPEEPYLQVLLQRATAAPSDT